MSLFFIFERNRTFSIIIRMEVLFRANNSIIEEFHNDGDAILIFFLHTNNEQYVFTGKEALSQGHPPCVHCLSNLGIKNIQKNFNPLIMFLTGSRGCPRTVAQAVKSTAAIFITMNIYQGKSLGDLVSDFSKN